METWGSKNRNNPQILLPSNLDSFLHITSMGWYNMITLCETNIYNRHYAHMKVVVAFLVVNFFGFSVITRTPVVGFGPK